MFMSSYGRLRWVREHPAKRCGSRVELSCPYSEYHNRFMIAEGCCRSAVTTIRQGRPSAEPDLFRYPGCPIWRSTTVTLFRTVLLAHTPCSMKRLAMAVRHREAEVPGHHSRQTAQGTSICMIATFPEAAIIGGRYPVAPGRRSHRGTRTMRDTTGRQRREGVV